MGFELGKVVRHDIHGMVFSMANPTIPVDSGQGLAEQLQQGWCPQSFSLSSFS